MSFAEESWLIGGVGGWSGGGEGGINVNGKVSCKGLCFEI